MARNNAASATSDGVPKRPSGIESRAVERASGVIAVMKRRR